jgi:hypothetical protein
MLTRQQFFSSGVFVSQMTPDNSILNLIDSIRPRTHDLIRIGCENDGGYLVPPSISECEACFSPGVANNSSFEKDLLNKFNIRSHLADASVDSPTDFEIGSFLGKYIAAYESLETTTLEKWVLETVDPKICKSLILQMDIEGAEYSSILSCPDYILNLFKIIVLEVHDVYAWGNESFFKIAREFFNKLLRHFTPIHLHPNNHMGAIYLRSILVPQGFELTLLRNDCLTSHNSEYASLPSALDTPNDPTLPELLLPTYWGFR